MTAAVMEVAIRRGGVGTAPGSKERQDAGTALIAVLRGTASPRGRVGSITITTHTLLQPVSESQRREVTHLTQRGTRLLNTREGWKLRTTS